LEDGAVKRLAVLAQAPEWNASREDAADVLARLAAHIVEGANRPDVPVAPAGTPFQQRVWARLRAIPRGETRTYGEVAATLGTAPRAVGAACRANPVLLLVPCHRVVARDGAGGFAGHTVGRWAHIKAWLLAAEAGPRR
jgi:methylated-DNA-[protein]-cysteine S-methyltransferase